MAREERKNCKSRRLEVAREFDLLFRHELAGDRTMITVEIRAHSYTELARFSGPKLLNQKPTNDRSTGFCRCRFDRTVC
jgi:hypothetical protein